MPGFDGTGPRGMGPMTGGGRGFCSPWGGGGMYGRGRGMPYSRAFPYGAPYVYPYVRMSSFRAPAYVPGFAPYAPPMNKEQELRFMKEEEQRVRNQLDQICSRLKELGG